MSVGHEKFVASRFDALTDRFKSALDRCDVRYAALERVIGPVRGLRLLDLGCGKGRFARLLAEAGAFVVGVDVSQGMLRAGGGFQPARASALRLPFAANSFDAAYSVEVFEHLPATGLNRALFELRRVVRRNGRIAIIDKNALALNAQRPWLPNQLVKWIDEHRGRWMYRPGEPVREHWFVPASFARRMRHWFDETHYEFLPSARESQSGVFRRFPAVRSLVCWSGRVPGGPDE